MKVAVIDIGTNSVRYMLCKSGKKLNIITKKTSNTRLGEGLSLNGKLKTENTNLTVDTVISYRNDALKQGAKKIYVYATESVRKAENRNALLIPLKSQNIDVDILSTDEEAEYTYQGAISTLKDIKDKKIAVLDIGGGSTEFAYGENGIVEFSSSQSIGSRRITDLCGKNKGLMDKLINSSLDGFRSALILDDFLVTGGTATTIASVLLGLEYYDSSKVQNYIIHRKDLQPLLCKMFAMDENQIRNMKGMHKERADIILGGVYILYRLMEHFRLSWVKVVDTDNMEGYVITKEKE